MVRAERRRRTAIRHTRTLRILRDVFGMNNRSTRSNPKYIMGLDAPHSEWCGEESIRVRRRKPVDY